MKKFVGFSEILFWVLPILDLALFDLYLHSNMKLLVATWDCITCFVHYFNKKERESFLGLALLLNCMLLDFEFFFSGLFGVHWVGMDFCS